MVDGTAAGIENEVARHKAVGTHEVALACDDAVLHARLVVERVAARPVRGARKARAIKRAIWRADEAVGSAHHTGVVDAGATRARPARVRTT